VSLALPNCYAPLFHYFGPERRSICFRKRQLIFAAGCRSDYVFFIERGGVKLTLSSPHGREAVLALLHQGELFGHEGLSDSKQRRSTNAIALTNVRVTRIDSGRMRQACSTSPAASVPLVSALVQLVTRLQLQLGSSLLHSTEERLARALLLLSEIAPEITPEKSDFASPRVSQQDLAEMIGATRQRVNVILQRFKKLGMIDYTDGLRIRDPLRKLVRSSEFPATEPSRFPD